MPQMSKVPFLLVSITIFLFFILWMVNVWFNIFSLSEKSSQSNQSNSVSSVWPLK